jgi:hypothetical protein
VIAEITNQYLLRIAFHDGAIDADQLIEFMGAMAEDAHRQFLLIVYNLPVHHAKIVT